MVFDRPFVDRSVVLYWMQLAILLFDEEEGCSIGAFGWSNGSSCGVFFDEFVEFF